VVDVHAIERTKDGVGKSIRARQNSRVTPLRMAEGYPGPQNALAETAAVFAPTLGCFALITLAAWSKVDLLATLAVLWFLVGLVVSLVFLNSRPELTKLGRAFCGVLGGFLLVGVNLFISFSGCVAAIVWQA
jgi:hypothetical protein